TSRNQKPLSQYATAPAPLLASRRRRFLSDLERLLVTFQRFVVAFQPVEHTALAQIGRRQHSVHGDGPVVTLKRLVGPAQSLERSSFFDERLGVSRLECDDLIETGQRLLGFIQAQQGLAFGQQQHKLRSGTGIRQKFPGRSAVVLYRLTDHEITRSRFWKGRALCGPADEFPLLGDVRGGWNGIFELRFAVRESARVGGGILLGRLFQTVEALFQSLNGPEKTRASQVGRVARCRERNSRGQGVGYVPRNQRRAQGNRQGHVCQPIGGAHQEKRQTEH